MIPLASFIFIYPILITKILTGTERKEMTGL